MARYTGPLCRLCRRESEKLFLKGDRCYTEKCAVERRKYPPGQHGQSRKKFSDYAVQLREKQKTKEIYNLLEKQFKNYFRLAEQKKGVTGSNLLQILESRLDNVVYRLGFVSNRRQARQLVLHGHVTVNDKRVNIPSCFLRAGDTVGLKEKSMKLGIVKENVEKIAHRGLPSWVELDVEKLQGRVRHLPARDEIALPVQEQLIVELYSK